MELVGKGIVKRTIFQTSVSSKIELCLLIQLLSLEVCYAVCACTVVPTLRDSP